MTGKQVRPVIPSVSSLCLQSRLLGVGGAGAGISGSGDGGNVGAGTITEDFAIGKQSGKSELTSESDKSHAARTLVLLERRIGAIGEQSDTHTSSHPSDSGSGKKFQ